MHKMLCASSCVYKWCGSGWRGIIKVVEDGIWGYSPTQWVLDCDMLVGYTQQHMHRLCIKNTTQHTPNQFI